MFNTNKKNYLKKIDKSQKGEIDKQIKPLIKLINSKKDYYTTSSCAGRILLIEISKPRKTASKWLFTSHNKVTFKQIKNIKLTKKNIWFKQEPFILHVMCRDLQSAQKLVNIARFVGFKRSGIQSIKSNFVEISSSEFLDTIIAKNGKWLIGDDYLKILIKEANKKLSENKNKIKKFYNKIKKV